MIFQKNDINSLSLLKVDQYFFLGNQITFKIRIPGGKLCHLAKINVSFEKSFFTGGE